MSPEDYVGRHAEPFKDSEPSRISDIVAGIGLVIAYVIGGIGLLYLVVLFVLGMLSGEPAMGPP